MVGQLSMCFAKALKNYFSQPGAKKQTEIAKALGVSDAHISGIVNGKSGSKEETRRKICELIDRTYAEMMDCQDDRDAQEKISGRRALPVTGENVDTIVVNWPKQTQHLVLVPVVRLEVVLTGAGVHDEDIVSWVSATKDTLVSDFVAVQLDHSPFAPRIRSEWTVIIDRSQREVEDGSYYLMRSPSRFLVQQAYQYKKTLVLLSCDLETMAPQIIDAGLCPDFIIGRVVRSVQRFL